MTASAETGVNCPSGHVSVLLSYPNLIPLSASKVRGIGGVLQPFEFDAI